MAEQSTGLILPFGQHWAAVLGLIIVTVYAWERFNEPTFPNRETLPRTVDPLRYLFLRPAYRKARLCYVAVSLSLYGLLVWPGASIIEVIGGNSKDFPPQAWALVVALVMVGFLPNTRITWLLKIEEQLRRWVHEWFLVPDGLKEIISTLYNAEIALRPSQLDSFPEDIKGKIYPDLKLPRSSLRHRWARVTIIMEMMRQILDGSSNSLKRAAFEAFDEDFDVIHDKYHALEKEVEIFSRSPSKEAEEKLSSAINNLLNRLYAYISWGIRHQADNEQGVARALEDLGFRITKRDGRRFSDVIFPAVLIIAVITMAFWLTLDAVNQRLSARSVLFAVTSTMAASIMYGRAIFVGLNRRSAKIKADSWGQTSPTSYISIAWIAGLTAWLTIIFSTIIWQIPAALTSVVAIAGVVKSMALGETNAAGEWTFLPIRLLTALPWMLAGAATSVLLAWRVGGDVRQTSITYRIIDIAIIGVGLSVAVAVSQLIQTSIAEMVGETEKANFRCVPVVAFIGLLYGAVVGFLVPQAWRSSILSPRDLTVARDLKDLLRQAEAKLGSKIAAEDWVFSPKSALGDVTPAEVVHHAARAASAPRLIENAISEDESEGTHVRPDWTTPKVIKGGRGSRG